MKRTIFTIIAALSAFTVLGARDFGDSFDGRTLRLDYILCGDATHQGIFLQQAYIAGEWAGRRTNLQSPLLQGNGQIIIRSLQGEVLYVNSFSNLFLEWQSYEEASRVPKAFECPLWVPFPREKVEVEVLLLNTRRQVSASIKHVIDPEDILIRKMSDNGLSRETLWEAAPLERAYDLVFVSEGYTESEKSKFFSDAERMMRELFAIEPYRSRTDLFNIRAVFSPSLESGVSQPGLGEWKNTAASAHYNTFYEDRYLTTTSLRKIYDIIGTTPAEQIVVIANSSRYGGGGVLNNITLVTSDHKDSGVVFVHEFGHSFAGLADEYDYGDNADPIYPDGIEPWEPNVTTLVDFSSKWQDMLPGGTPIPTPKDEIELTRKVRAEWQTFSKSEQESLNLKVGVYEGAGYRTTGVYRPVQECRMRMNECENFCPVCTRAIIRMINYCTGND